MDCDNSDSTWVHRILINGVKCQINRWGTCNRYTWHIQDWSFFKIACYSNGGKSTKNSCFSMRPLQRIGKFFPQFFWAATFNMALLGLHRNTLWWFVTVLAWVQPTWILRVLQFSDCRLTCRIWFFLLLFFVIRPFKINCLFCIKKNSSLYARGRKTKHTHKK